MRFGTFLQFARRELTSIDHPYDPGSVEPIREVDLAVWVVDAILREGTGRYEALSENFYEALGVYLHAPRHQKASLRSAIERLAVHFEGFARTAVVALLPEHDVELLDGEGKSRGKLSETGYIKDIVAQLYDENVNLWKKREDYWKGQPIWAAIYGVCFRHQQRAKHEARDYSLVDLEILAVRVLAAYLFLGRYVIENTDIREHVARRRDFADSVAVYHWPDILLHRLTDLRFGGEDADLQEQQGRLLEQAQALRDSGEDLRAKAVGVAAEEFRKFFVSVEVLAEEYEMLITESNMRDWGRDMEADQLMG